jgi:RHS repeat-associated protein
MVAHRGGPARGAGDTPLYDAVTNRLKKLVVFGGSITYSYDRAGNLIQRSDWTATWTYGYDALERLVSVRRDGTLIARYGYDVQGRRIVKRVYSGASGGVVGYLRMSYAGSQVSFETDSAGAIQTKYTWGPGTDLLGSVRALVKRNGTWAGHLRYDPYGNLVDSAGPQPPLRYRWTGREWDGETGFYFHRSRYYDPQAQRFVQEDPIGYEGGPNLYAYVGGQPLTVRDPSGLKLGDPWTMEQTPDGSCMDIDGSISHECVASGWGGGSTPGERQALALQLWAIGAELRLEAWSAEKQRRQLEARINKMLATIVPTVISGTETATGTAVLLHDEESPFHLADFESGSRYFAGLVAALKTLPPYKLVDIYIFDPVLGGRLWGMFYQQPPFNRYEMPRGFLGGIPAYAEIFVTPVWGPFGEPITAVFYGRFVAPYYNYVGPGLGPLGN